MNTIVGLFEDPNHVVSVVDALKQAGINAKDIRPLGKEYITEEADRAALHKRASDLSGIFGVLVGGFAGMAISAAVASVLSFLTGSVLGSIGIELVLILGAAVGASLGAFLGVSFAPSLMVKFNLLDHGKPSPTAHLIRNGFLVAVNANETNRDIVTKIMRKKEAIRVEAHAELWAPVSLQAAQG
ncbi:MAG TPA: hypothetical protein PKE64_21575 [Anaerolineae bacterium]|nr:hypothetical protein [Anaerolineae bacterium]HMR66612.1 hypothetical protein [Anaerolineae bacterium]